MTYKNTFSECVDEIIEITKRTDQIGFVPGWLNLTISECSKQALFDRDLIEDQATATADPFILNVPRDFRKLITFQYADTGAYPKFVKPGPRQERYDNYWYRGTNYWVFKGCGDSVINLAYYRNLPSLVYYDVADRPARYVIETDTWEYHATYDVNDATREVARDLVSNWLLMDYFDTIQQGVLTKLYNSVGDEKRAKTAYSLFQQRKVDILATESHQSEGTNETGDNDAT